MILKKVICIHEVTEENIQKFDQAISKWIKRDKVDFSNIKESSLI